MSQDKHYLCTRPTLATLLSQAGVRMVMTDNPFAINGRHSQAWSVDLTEVSAKIIADYYTSIGKPTPATVAAFIRGCRP